MRKSILRHCSLHSGVTEFALLYDDGNYFKLDEAGNFKVLLQTGLTAEKIRVTVKGHIDREILYVTSIGQE